MQPSDTWPAIAVDLGHRPATALIVHSCARCGAPLATSAAQVDAALHAHRVGCPGPAELPPAADA